MEHAGASRPRGAKGVSEDGQDLEAKRGKEGIQEDWTGKDEGLEMEGGVRPA